MRGVVMGRLAGVAGERLVCPRMQTLAETFVVPPAGFLSPSRALSESTGIAWEDAKPFEEIPGPRPFPVVGCLPYYLPYIESTGIAWEDAKPFEEIPGPRPFPVVGCLPYYLPYIGK
ncbi:hypothetical protein GWK47_007670 [Chionoecetes opilio]|uniref:Uncharacterized protein n=1 Tax=Chionoecetes opilio TaxID=41210 RepID=A0A8J4Y1C4_CHIOP|nr:hypothetical protein GWK47_007670 [Chionoecetes opilio]